MLTSGQGPSVLKDEFSALNHTALNVSPFCSQLCLQSVHQIAKCMFLSLNNSNRVVLQDLF